MEHFQQIGAVVRHAAAVATTFIAAARLPFRSEWVRGLRMERRSRKVWRSTSTSDGGVDTLATIGAADDDLISRELARDPTDHVEASGGGARGKAARGGEAGSMEKVIHDPMTSLAMKATLAAGPSCGHKSCSARSSSRTSKA